MAIAFDVLQPNSTKPQVVHPQSVRPKSAVNHWAALASLCGAILVLATFKWLDNRDLPFCLVAVAVFIALPHAALALASWESLPFATIQKQSFSRVAIKLWGQICLFALVGMAYFIFQGFSENYLLPLSGLGNELLLLILVATPPYLWFTDLRMANPEDGLYHVGLLFLGKFRALEPDVIRKYLLGWVVKGFFGPLMAGFALNDLKWFLDLRLPEGVNTATNIYEALYRMIYFIDVLFALTGYLCTFRLLDTQIRSTEPTMVGWVVCLLCYPPFWDLFSHNFLPYEEGYYWMDWLGTVPVLWYIWAGLIIASTAIYTWATVSFGIRFSNLTNRGILTNGPYRWVKHPAYLTKNFSWWLISVPFVSTSSYATIVRDCIALMLLNVVYYLRAKTEESHLSRDPDYVAYLAWINQNGIYAQIKHRLRR